MSRSNNAGKFADRFALSDDGVEMTFATNYLDTVFFLASKLLKTIPQAAATTCYVAVHPAVAGVSGKYFADCNEASPSRLGSSGEEAAKLWRFSEEIAAEEKEESVHVGSFRLQVQSSNADRGLAFA
uniref:Uncharacterized protein n=1 Tax=Oryza brachyantha TaxID=4533 RepID=J3MAX9_ORYBR